MLTDKMICKCFAALAVLFLMLAMVSCAGKDSNPDPLPVPSGEPVPDGNEGEDSGATEDGQTEDIRDMVTNLRIILDSLDERRKNGSAGVPGEQTVPGRRTMLVPVEDLIMVSRTYDEEKHLGIDLIAQNGNTVYAAYDGFVADEGSDEILGNYVIIEHGGGIMTVYSHLSSYTAEVETYVKQGDTIGYLGGTGQATGPHLDFRVLVDGTETDPEPFLNVQIQNPNT